MISPKAFIDYLGEQGIDFFAGVPDSLLKNICAYISDTLDAKHNIITANEGGAVGLAAGYHLASGRIGCVYMQNSGEGNVINPLASLTDKDVYGIPVLLIIGWRGKPGFHDEPQHVKQGKITLSLLETMGIPYAVLDKEDGWRQQVSEAVHHMEESGEVYALVIEKDTFEPYALNRSNDIPFEMSREEAIRAVARVIGPKDVIVSTTGMISRELFEYRTAAGEGHEKDFLTVGSMGHASQIALGIALQKPDRRVWCFDGDGATLMHMGSLAIVAEKAPANYRHIIFNNGAHDSVGGQPTVGLRIDFPAIAKAVGYKSAFSVETREELERKLGILQQEEGPILLEIKVRKGNRKDLGRPTTTPVQNKTALMEYLKD